MTLFVIFKERKKFVSFQLSPEIRHNIDTTRKSIFALCSIYYKNELTAVTCIQISIIDKSE